MSDCCAVADPQTLKESCPECGHKGRPVSAKTVQAILKPGLSEGSPGSAPRLCANPSCDLLYFAGEWLARKSDARVRVGLKESTDPVPLCYCFGFTRADVRAEVRATGESSITARIAAEVQAGRCACEIKNPAGHCCLGEVRKAVGDEQALATRREAGTGGAP